ncbi:hypothetical protein [Trebonia sp.]|uniref:hypothetical protein n=1 Tax=Trebonia sp. TaxID=2767075 RepID=UPI00260B4BCE|nr:hypothetical protein [Trebonia sp.]
MTNPGASNDLALLRDDLAYHQARVLILIDAVAGTPRNANKLDGLTKLAKLDFLLRYPALAPKVLDSLDPDDNRLHLSTEQTDRPTDVESPMVRYKYGPWDHRYYPVIGALVSRGLVRYAKGRRGNVALAPTTAGRRFARDLAATTGWAEVRDRSMAIAEASAGLTGNALKDLIYGRLAELMDRPQREVIQ